MTLQRDAHSAAVSSLRKAKQDGVLTSEMLESTARAIGRHQRTLRRWMQHGAPAFERQIFQASEADIEAFFAANGRYTVAWRRRQREERAAHRQFVSRPTFERALKRELSPADRAFARQGEGGRRARSLYAPYEVGARNERWEMDACLLQVQVTHRGNALRPWLLLILDSKTRAIMGWGLFPVDAVSSAEALAVLHDAILINLWHGPFGGAPNVLVIDNDRAFLAHAMTHALAALNIMGHATDPYAPHQKGKIERVFATIIEEFLADSPRFGGAPRTAAGERYQSTKIPSLKAVQAEFALWVDRYNLHRSHRTLKTTPLEVWDSDSTPLRVYSAGELRFLLAFRAERIVQKQGINLDGNLYIAPELNNLVGERVEVRRNPGDHRCVQVLRDGEHVCTAPLRDLSNREQAEAIAAARHKDRQRADRHRREATRRQGIRIAAMPDDPHVQEQPTPRAHSPAGPDQAKKLRLAKLLGSPDRDGDA